MSHDGAIIMTANFAMLSTNTGLRRTLHRWVKGLLMFIAGRFVELKQTSGLQSASWQEVKKRSMAKENRRESCFFWREEWDWVQLLVISASKLKTVQPPQEPPWQPRFVPWQTHIISLQVVKRRASHVLFWPSNALLFLAARQRLPDRAKHVSVVCRWKQI